MKSNLFKRIITSIVLLIILSFCLVNNKYLWLILLTITSIISLYEFNELIRKAFKNKNKLIYLFQITNILFFTSFIIVGYKAYNSPPVGIIFVILICIFSDTGGYIVGRLLGGKKLTKISPNKTISGSFGSFIFSLFPLIIFFIIYPNTENLSLNIKNLISIIFVSLFLSFVCQAGDLLVSYFKRKAKVKDTGSILPGHGGLLDRIDGMIFALPAAYIIDKILF